MKPLPSIERLRQLLHYDAECGTFSWCVIGGRAERATLNGYFRINIDGYRYLAHRIAWAMHYGEEPPPLIDHINGDRSNNCIGNLRRATFVQNRANARVARRNKLGVKGVRRHRGRYSAEICVSGKRIYLGIFSTIDEASAAYAVAAFSHFGEFARCSTAATERPVTRSLPPPNARLRHETKHRIFRNSDATELHRSVDDSSE